MRAFFILMQIEMLRYLASLALDPGQSPGTRPGQAMAGMTKGMVHSSLLTLNHQSYP